jgi:Zn finger protein HypA/HybF involved in hydrogenase expression
MIYTTALKNGKIIFNKNKEPIKCPICGSIDTIKQGIAYTCPYCKSKFIPNDNED